MQRFAARPHFQFSPPKTQIGLRGHRGPRPVEVQLLARYPFLPQAREHIRTTGYKTGELLADAPFERARSRAMARVRGAMAPDGIPDAATASEAEAELELLSYPVARMILAHVGDSYLSNRYAVAESKLSSHRLAHEDAPDTVWAVAAGLGLPLEPPDEGGSFARMHFLDYLRYAPTRDAAWKLVNQPLRGGFVSLSRDRVIRLAEEGLRDRILEELESLERPGREVARAFPRELNELTVALAAHRARFRPEEGGELRVEAFPPCMKAIWTGIQNHVNIPHMGRFAIVSFLHKLGMDSEAILRFFSAVPDFDVNKSRYQIEHITGKIGGSTEYTPPNCSTMQTYGICPLEQRDYICLNLITHPLGYYRKRLRQLPAKPSPPAAAEPAAKAPEATHAG